MFLIAMIVLDLLRLKSKFDLFHSIMCEEAMKVLSLSGTENRERTGAFFTPPQWVKLSQEYLARAFGENWQKEYYIWDCAAGTGNLLIGLIDKSRIWASTLEHQDVDFMHECIRYGANLLKDNVFQFDFINDDWKPRSQGGKIPDNLYDIITDLEKQKKLIIYINPPYAEATSSKSITGTGKPKNGVAKNNKIQKQALQFIGKAANELFALFLFQIYSKIPNCKIGIFSTPKFIQSTNFSKFRDYFLAKYLGGFVVPAYTFDNVIGEFPISFTIWNCEIKQRISELITDVYNEKGELIGYKVFRAIEKYSINKWIRDYADVSNNYAPIGYLSCPTPNFQRQDTVFIQNRLMNGHFYKPSINLANIIPCSIYFSVRHCIKADWLNNRDQFYYPDDGWQNDREFIADSLIFILFHNQNRISIKQGPNHWIPFSEVAVNARARYKYHTMIEFLEGRVSADRSLFPVETFRILDYLSPEAQKVYEVGLKLWRYYHSQPDANPDAAFYDIKEYFRGRTPDGRLKQKSDDLMFEAIMDNLRHAMETLASHIAEKTYKYGFLRQ